MRVNGSDPNAGYCWNVVAEEFGQVRVSVVELPFGPLRSVQHSPRVEEMEK